MKFFAVLVVTFSKTNIIFQLDFINKPIDSKPLRDLLLEYKADVVEEEVVDEEMEVLMFFIIQKVVDDSLEKIMSY